MVFKPPLTKRRFQVLGLLVAPCKGSYFDYLKNQALQLKADPTLLEEFEKERKRQAAMVRI